MSYWRNSVHFLQLGKFDVEAIVEREFSFEVKMRK
jgi:hypothetical protein